MIGNRHGARTSQFAAVTYLGASQQTFQNGHIYCTCNDASTHAIQGAIDGRYQKPDVNGPAGGNYAALGFPISNEISLVNDGKFNSFAFPNAQGKAGIYWTLGTNAQVVKGAIFDAWAGTKYETGPLGYPISEEFGISGGVQQNFQNGRNITFVGGQAVVH